jgi:nucleoside-diphosphate-sugar epimerase
MRIFLTGGTGFIGSHFINQAHKEGHEIVALRRSSNSNSRIPLQREPQWIESSLETVDYNAIAGCEVIVHMAAHSANIPYDTLEECLKLNVLAPLALFRVAISAGIRRFIVAGSCFEYGKSGERYEFIPTNAMLEPTATYPASKAAASIAFHQLAQEEKLELIILRIFQVYGEGEIESRFWPSLRRSAIAGHDFPMSLGLQVRDFVPVETVVAKFLQTLSRGDILPGVPIIENVGSGSPQTLLSFATQEWTKAGAIGKLIPGVIPMRPGEVMRYVPEV